MSLRKEDALGLYLDDPSSQSRIREKGVDLKLSASCLSHPRVSPWHYHAPNRKSTEQEFEDGAICSWRSATLNISQKRIDVILSFVGLKIIER